jgi:anti-sigma factor RsiW
MMSDRNSKVGCRTIKAQLDALAGSPASDLPLGVTEHLAECSTCAKAVAATRLARGLVAQIPDEPLVPAGFADRVLVAIARHSRRDEDVAELWAPSRKLLPAFAAAAACCVILFQVMVWNGPVGSPPDEALTPDEQLVLGVTPPDPDAVLTVVMAGDAQ